MNLGELRAQFRRRVDDLAGKKLWADPEIDSYINEAYFEAAERSLSIEEDVRVSLRASKASYIVTGALRIDRILIDGQRRPLPMAAVFDLDRQSPGWQERANGTPDIAIPSTDRFQLSPAPAVDGQATVTVRRLPRNLLAQDSDEPEIPARYHLRMLDWAFHLAYDKRDADAQAAQLAATYAARFTESFGDRLTAKQQRGRSDARRHVTRPSW